MIKKSKPLRHNKELRRVDLGSRKRKLHQGRKPELVVVLYDVSVIILIN